MILTYDSILKNLISSYFIRPNFITEKYKHKNKKDSFN